MNALLKQKRKSKPLSKLELENHALKLLVANLSLEQASCTDYAKTIATHMSRHWKDVAPQWRPAEDLLLILSQIDNMAAGMKRS